MDDWTYYPDADAPSTQPALLDQDWRTIQSRRDRAQQAEAARVAELVQAEALAAVHPHADADVPLPFAAPPGAALAF